MQRLSGRRYRGKASLSVSLLGLLTICGFDFDHGGCMHALIDTYPCSLMQGTRAMCDLHFRLRTAADKAAHAWLVKVWSQKLDIRYSPSP